MNEPTEPPTTAPTTAPAPAPATRFRRVTYAPGETAMLPLKDVAVRLGVRLSTARTWIRLGYIRGHRFGNRCYRVHERDLQAFIKAHETVEPRLPGEGVAS